MTARTSKRALERPRVRAEVDIGCMVRLQIFGESAEWEVTIVPTEEANPEQDLISNECPIGEALLGRKVGDTVRVTVPSGSVQYRVLGVKRSDVGAAGSLY